MSFEITHKCKRCNEVHLLEYQIQKNGTKHLTYRCPNRKLSKKDNAVEFLPFIPDLPIDSYKSAKSVKALKRQQPNQISLMGEL